MPNGNSTETCLFCIPIRKGVLALLSIALILNIISMVMLVVSLARLIAFTNGDSQFVSMWGDVIASLAIAAAIYLFMTIFIAWGLRSAYCKRAPRFKIFVRVYAILNVISLIMLIFRPDMTSIITSVLSIYWVYVCHCYWKVINAESEAAPSTAQPNMSAA